MLSEKHHFASLTFRPQRSHWCIIGLQVRVRSVRTRKLPRGFGHKKKRTGRRTLTEPRASTRRHRHGSAMRSNIEPDTGARNPGARTSKDMDTVTATATVKGQWHARTWIYAHGKEHRHRHGFYGLVAVAYLGFQKGGAKLFAGHQCSNKGGQAKFSNFFTM